MVLHGHLFACERWISRLFSSSLRSCRVSAIICKGYDFFLWSRRAYDCLTLVFGSEQGYLLKSCSGIWLILFGAIAAGKQETHYCVDFFWDIILLSHFLAWDYPFSECTQAPAEMKRRFFFCEVPVRYYPVALYVFFAFLGGDFSIAYAISMGAGYLYGQGRLDEILKLSNGKAKEWENSFLSSLTNKPGWVVGHAALGSDAWSQIQSSGTSLLVRVTKPVLAKTRPSFF